MGDDKCLSSSDVVQVRTQLPQSVVWHCRGDKGRREGGWEPSRRRGYPLTREYSRRSMAPGVVSDRTAVLFRGS